MSDESSLFDVTKGKLYNENDFIRQLRADQALDRESSSSVSSRRASSRAAPATSDDSAVRLDSNAAFVLGAVAGLVGFAMGASESGGSDSALGGALLLGGAGFVLGLLWRVLVALAVLVVVLGVLGATLASHFGGG